MNEDEDEEPSSEADFEEWTEAIQEEREERQEQVSFEWVETVRETGELWRDVDDVETVAEETDLSLETTREALTVYRLIFEDPSDVGRKASRPARAYFSLEQEIDDVFDEEDEDEPVEDLLREYVGAVYLDNDIENLAVGAPPEEEIPPLPVDWEELSETFSQSFTFPEPAIKAVAKAVDPDLFRTEKMIADAIQPLFDHRQKVIANAVQPIINHRERMIANAVQPLIEHRQRMISQSLAPLAAALEHQQNIIAQSTAVKLSEAIPDITFPDSVLADLAAIQPSVNVSAAAATHPTQFEESVVAETSTTTTEAEPLEATAEIVPETGVTSATVDATLPDADSLTTELVVEIPAMLVGSMLSTGKARVWFTNLSDDHQLTAVRLLLASVAVYVTGNPFAASIAIIPAPSVRRAIVREDESD